MKLFKIISALLEDIKLEPDQKVYGFGLLAGLATLAFVLALHWLGAFTPLENAIQSYQFKHFRKKADLHNTPIVFVSITEDSLTSQRDEFGNWPWLKNYTALPQDLLSNFEPPPRVIAYDIPFNFPDPPSDSGDDDLAGLIADEKSTVLSMTFKKKGLPPQGTTELISRFRTRWSEHVNPRKLNNLITPIPKLIKASEGIGHNTFNPDSDGVVRSLEMVVQFEGNWYPSVSLLVACRYLNVDPKALIIEPGKITLPGAKNLRGEDVIIPIDNQGRTYINYYGTYYPDSTVHPRLQRHDIKDPLGLIFTIGLRENALHEFLFDTFGSAIQNRMAECTADTPPDEDLITAILEKLNTIINSGKSLYTEDRFVDINLSQEVRDELTKQLSGDALAKRNVTLLMDSFPGALQSQAFRIVDFIAMAKIFRNVLDDEVTESDINLLSGFQNKIVLKHVDAGGVINFKPTPLEKQPPTMSIHANMIQNILSGDFLRPIDKEYRVWGLLALSLVLLLIIAEMGTIMGMVLSLISIVATLAISAHLFHDYSLFFPTGGWLMAFSLPYVANTLTRYYSEQQEKAKVKGVFSKYVSGDLVDELVKNPEILNRPGQEKELTIFFSDLSGFTTISEKFKSEPTKLVALLNDYLNTMSEIIQDQQGCVDRYEGDAIFAYYNAPLDLEGHAAKACRSALECHRVLDIMRAEWMSQGLPEVKARIGVCTGEVIFGNMGAEGKAAYTTHGDNSHFAERLEQESKMWGTKLLISERTHDMAGNEFFTRQMDIIPHGSMDHLVKIYELLGTTDNPPESHVEFVPAWNEAYQAYLNKEWDKAIELFKKAHELFSEENGCDIYIERCNTLKANPPQGDWNGLVRDDLH